MAHNQYAIKPNSVLGNLTEGVRATVDRTTLKQSDWICRNFRHPKDNRKNWNFTDHEYQIEIVNCGDDAQEVDTKKCAQVGLSTVQINWALTFGAQHDFMKLAYVLPTAKFATEFAKLRIDPAIEASPVISDLLSSDADNTGMKKIGTCFLVMRGTSGESQAISVDLDAIIIDELNFCNFKILSAMSSRLQHSELKLYRRFSTPTLPDFGISANYNSGSQALRAVKCDHCTTWVTPSFFNDVVIPGMANPIAEYRKGDHTHPGVAEAYLACPHCRKALTTDNLNDPKKREWVHKFPDRSARSYAVKPWDVPKYNPIPEVLYSIKEYNYQDWNNFRLGEDYESAENSFIQEVIKRNSVVRPVGIESLRAGTSGYYHVFIGADLGNTNHIMVGATGPSGTLDIICPHRITSKELQALYAGEASFGKWLKELCLAVFHRKLVIDHMPSYEPALFVTAHLPQGTAYGAFYVGDKQGQLDVYAFDDKKGVVNINRTKHFDDLAGAVNSGVVRFPYEDHPETELIRKHLGAMKKLTRINSKGQKEEYWDSTSPEDHYGHALGYLWSAFASVEKRFGPSPIAMLPTPSRVKVK